MMAARHIFLLAVAASFTASEAAIASDSSELSTLIPQQSCYYQQYNKRLTCKCAKTDSAVKLHLRMKYYVFNQGNEIKSVHLEHCKELHVTLDLTEVDATKFPVHFRAVRHVNIEKIVFEPRYSDRQELEIVLENVERLDFDSVFVEDTIKLRANNVKEMHFVNSTFAHIPRNGFRVSRAKTLNIRHSTFLRLAPQSIVVDKTKEVIVLKNEMSVNAIEAVYAKDGSYLMISCNRLIGQPVSPECTWTTTTASTTTTTTTTTPTQFLINQGNLRDGEDGGGGIEKHLPELIGGVVAGFVVITVLILLLVCVIRKTGGKQKQQQQPTVVSIEADTPPPKQEAQKPPPQVEERPAPKESDSLLESPGPEELVEEDEEEGPRFSAPIWLEEIQKNKIFNRQKSLLSQERLKDIAEIGLAKEAIAEVANDDDDCPPPPPPPPPRPVESHEMTPILNGGLSEDDVKESSRTESDEEFHPLPLPVMPKKKAPVPLPPTPSPRPSKSQKVAERSQKVAERKEEEEELPGAVEEMDELLQKVRDQERELLQESGN